MPVSSPSLALRALFARTSSRLGFDRPAGTVAGLSPAVKALAAVAAARARPGLTVLVVPTDRDVEQMVADGRYFYAALEGAAAAAADTAVVPCPSLQVDPYRGMAPRFKVAAARARALYLVATGQARLVVASAAALLPRVSPPERLLRASIEIRSGTEIAPHDLADLLVDAGFSREDPVDEHGSFAVRGGIVDIFPAADDEPVRLEFVGDMVETLRRFEPATQRSTAAVDHVVVVPVRETFAGLDDDGERAEPTLPMLDFLSARGVRLLVAEHEQVSEQAVRVREQLDASFGDAGSRGRSQLRPPSEAFVTWDDLADRLGAVPRLEELALGEPGPGLREVRCQPAMEFHGRVGDWVADLRQARERGDTVLFVADSAGRAERVVEILRDYDIVAVPVERAEDGHAAAVLVAVGTVSRGFRLTDAALQVYVERDVFDEERRAGDKHPGVAKAFLSDLRDLKVGDLVVHVDHGIGEFVGLKQLGVSGSARAQEFLELRYSDDAKLFVPVERLDLIQKYTGGTRPALDRLGGTTWEKAKSRVKKAMRDMAVVLLRLYAQRKAVAGFAFSPDTHWQEEFEGAFPYELTPDQTTSIADIKRDMESPTPMDRLLCGDVGYGKTEVAMRAAFKAVMDGKQVAVLAPTTVLAFQHQKTLVERFSGFPVTIDMVSRFRTRQEIKEALDKAAEGKLDILVGTHRLLSKDVLFKDLGLLVVDEEQRFGVAHKERIKQMRKKVDVLTLTATPIPRTLNMSLVGIRDMSVIETAPKDRLAIQTNVVKFDSNVIVRAIRSEIERGGQIYFVHNRVESIYSMGNLIQRLVPEARVVIGHGQMAEDTLERAMLDFMAHKFDVLLCTTIVENGLDIPNANTMVINRADRYGLSQLYQLRGRVGRSDRAAYAYLLIPPEEALSPVARKRLSAIKEFSELGSGFRVAALDLEIRGAGNLLGGEQSGTIDAVGFEMYMKLLEETIRELKGEDLEDDLRATVNLKVDFRLDESYVPDMNQRLMIYRRIAGARSEDEIGRIVDEVRDRYGPTPTAVLNLADFARIRVLADGLGVETIDRADSAVVFKFRQKSKVDLTHVIALVQQRGDLQLVPPNSLKLDLKKPVKPVAKSPLEVVAEGRRSKSDGLKVAKIQRKPSWWTVRATAGEVTPGFTKAEILKQAPEDPRAPEGVLTKVTELLEELQS